MKCTVDVDIDFVKLDCITGECKNTCQIRDDINIIEKFDKDNIKYYVFETVVTTGFDPKGKAFQYSKTARVNNKGSLKEVYQKLQECAKAYFHCK